MVKPSYRGGRGGRRFGAPARRIPNMQPARRLPEKPNNQPVSPEPQPEPGFSEDKVDRTGDKG